MSFDFEQGKKKRDERLRRRILETLQMARGFAPKGELSGPRLMAESSSNLPADMDFEDGSHFLRLCLDLVNHELVSQREGVARRRGQLFAPEHAVFAITGKGTQLIDEVIPPIAGIDDERIVEGT